MTTFDIAVIGGGPGGYVAAIRASQLGKKVVLIEKDELGGTCLNRGCIPSKTFLRYAEVIESINRAKQWGIESGDLSFSLEKMMDRKNRVINTLRAGISGLLRKDKITHISGEAKVLENKQISVHTQKDDVKTISADKIIIATGGKPFVPPIKGIDTIEYETSDTIFDLETLPQSITIIGGGVIGVEFADIFSHLNVDVTIVEMAESLVPEEDRDATRLLQKRLEQANVRVLLQHEVTSVEQVDGETHISVNSAKGNTEVIKSEKVIVAVGRKPNLTVLEELSLQMDGPFVSVNRSMETSIPSIYAIGDIVGGYQLAHVASAEGIVAAHHAAGEEKVFDDKVIPRCIYTTLEIASVGLSEKEAKDQNKKYRVETFQLAANGKAIAMDATDGFVKLIIDETYGEVLGVVMAGARVTEMISQASSYMFLEGTVEELEMMIQPHPSVSESMFEVAASWLGRGIHS